jgi:hypothetical protein
MPYKLGKNKAKLKDRKGGRPIYPSDKSHKKTDTVKEDCWGSPPRRLMHTIFELHAPLLTAKMASMEKYRRERSSLEMDPGAREYENENHLQHVTLSRRCADAIQGPFCINHLGRYYNAELKPEFLILDTPWD